MKYVPFDHCKSYYRRTGLDFDTLWPAHTTCAQSVLGGECVWRSGAILVTKVDHRWRLLGFGVYGPGCQAPARFLDYGMYHTWVKETFTDIGKPALSTVADNHLVMRRSMFLFYSTLVSASGFTRVPEGKVDLFVVPDRQSHGEPMDAGGED
ncbi:uncharacterized protein LOC118279083 [Spodoptera frugiperda]|uniref:Uncharacterized protein LOC118279083 n=1 Tax=Spodoptera frugiperda TaxID=7108 RepID=A0A9R0DW20_SPOFR|nr:uncharacterized protein LOC118279083 [Spodoptera frugiperda]